MFATVFWPGPTNQKSVPGPWHEAVAIPPAAVCSASKPCAMDPLAWIITPPLAGPVGTAEPDARLASRVRPRARAGADATFTSASRPGWVRTCSGAGVVAEPTGDSRAILASPVPFEAAASAIPDAVAPDEPGAGQALTAAVTAARPAAGVRGLARAAGRLMLARPNSAASAVTTSSASRYLFARICLTRRRLRNRVPGPASAGRVPRRRLARAGRGVRQRRAAAGRAHRCGRLATRTAAAAQASQLADRTTTAGSRRAAASSRTGCAEERGERPAHRPAIRNADPAGGLPDRTAMPRADPTARRRAGPTGRPPETFPRAGGGRPDRRPAPPAQAPAGQTRRARAARLPGGRGGVPARSSGPGAARAMPGRPGPPGPAGREPGARAAGRQRPSRAPRGAA